jgi:hypothetical protein
MRSLPFAGSATPIGRRQDVAVAAALSLMAIASSAHGQAASTLWGCDAPAGRTCYFSIQFAASGVRNFSLPAGRKMAMGGVTPGVDRYQVSIDAPNLGDLNRCKQLIAVGRSCQRKVVDASYND